VQGVVILETVIGPDGKVQDARVLRSIPLLDQAAVESVRQWEFTPTLLNGSPVPVIMTVTVQFSLGN
jgi:protein TonB